MSIHHTFPHSVFFCAFFPFFGVGLFGSELTKETKAQHLVSLKHNWAQKLKYNLVPKILTKYC